MHVKKLLCVLTALCVALSLAACAGAPAPAASASSESAGPVRQTASAVLDRDGRAVFAEIDLSGGWSVEFASGAFYLYDREVDENTEAAVIGVTLDEEVFEGYRASAEGMADLREIENGFAYTEETGSQMYLTTVGEDAYFLLDVAPNIDGDAAFARVYLERAEEFDYYEPGPDYLVLVNKLNPLPEGWEDEIEIVSSANSLGDTVLAEAEAYNAYLALKESLAAEGVYVDLDSAYRSVAEQQEIMDRFIKEYGAEYARKTVAQPGYSEHHTGLALDLYLNVDGSDVYLNEDMVLYPEIWKKIHEKLPEYGFILRYPEGKEHVTGYGYEPWHIRYVGDPDVARWITDSGLTLEGLLGAAEETDVDIDYGSSSIFTPEELADAAVQIKCDFASWEGCALHSLRYAGDEACTEENLSWLNSFRLDTRYVQIAEFLGNFHSPVDGLSAWDPDTEYEDHQWWLGRDESGSWEIVSVGY